MYVTSCRPSTHFDSTRSWVFCYERSGCVCACCLVLFLWRMATTRRTDDHCGGRGEKKDKQPSATKPYVRAFPTRQLCPCYCALRPTTTCLMNHVRFVAPFCFVCWIRGRIHRIQILRGVLGSSSRCRTTQSYYVVVALSQMMFEY